MSDDEKPSNVLSLVKAREDRSAKGAPVSIATFDGDGADVVSMGQMTGENGHLVLVALSDELCLGLTPDQADEAALELVRYAAGARSMGEKT